MQRHGVARRVAHAQAFVEPGFVLQIAEQGQEAQADHEGPGHAPDHVMQLEVPELVRQHGLDLVLVEARDERVEEHDALGLAEAGEVGVAVAAAARAVHHEQAAGLEAALGQQLLDAALERAFLHGRELVEQRRDERGIDGHDEQAERRPTPATRRPTNSRPSRCISQSTASTSGRPERQADRGMLGEIARATSRGVILLKPKRASMLKVR